MLDRPRLRRLLGIALPESQQPLAVRREGAVRHVGVDIERIQLVADDRVVPALVLSTSPPPWRAAVVAIHQHARQFHLGKSEPAGMAGDPQMAYGLRMAAKGIPVIAPDLLGFEDRMLSQEDPAAAEQRIAWQLAASGRALQGNHSDDVSLAVSWIREQLDGTGSIGVIGHSLGGQVALFTMAVDPRIRAGVVSCGAGSLESFSANGILHNPAFYVPGLVSAGDVPAVAALLDGQSLFLSAGDQDPLFPTAGVDAVVAQLDRRSCIVERFAGGHEFPLGVQQPAIEWLTHKLTSLETAA